MDGSKQEKQRKGTNGQNKEIPPKYNKYIQIIYININEI